MRGPGPLPGTQDENNRDSASDCAADEELNRDSCCVACTRGPKPDCDEGERWVADGACDWRSETVSERSCENVSGVTREYETWSRADCSYVLSTSYADPQPASNACGSATFSTASCGWDGPPTVPPEPTGCPGQGQAWGSLNTNTCNFGTVAVTAPTDCSGSLEWLQNCTWRCVIKQCSTVTQPTSKVDCTEPINLGILKVHGFRQKTDGWYWYRNRTSAFGGTVLPASEGLCIACGGSTQSDIVVNACESTPPTSCDENPPQIAAFMNIWSSPLTGVVWSQSDNAWRADSGSRGSAWRQLPRERYL